MAHTLHTKKRKPLRLEDPLTFEFGKGGRAKRKERRKKRTMKQVNKIQKRLDKRLARKLKRNPDRADKLNARFAKKSDRLNRLAEERINRGGLMAGLRGVGDNFLSNLGMPDVFRETVFDINTPEILKSLGRTAGEAVISALPGGQQIVRGVRTGVNAATNLRNMAQAEDAGLGGVGEVGGEGQGGIPNFGDFGDLFGSASGLTGLFGNITGGGSTSRYNSSNIPVAQLGGLLGRIFGGGFGNQLQQGNLGGSQSLGQLPFGGFGGGQGGGQGQSPLGGLLGRIFGGSGGGQGRPSPFGGGMFGGAGGFGSLVQDAGGLGGLRGMIDSGKLASMDQRGSLFEGRRFPQFGRPQAQPDGAGFNPRNFLGMFGGGRGRFGGFRQVGGQIPRLPLPEQLQAFVEQQQGIRDINNPLFELMAAIKHGDFIPTAQNIDKEVKRKRKGNKKFFKSKNRKVRKFQQGGLVDIQAEKGELIYHPTGYLSPVHAKEMHSKLERRGDDDVITDHPLEGSFIFSDFLKLKKADADDMVVGVKRYPYKEGEKGKEPEIYTVGDLFNKKERKNTPAKLANRVSKIYKVTDNNTDVFDVLGDQFNLQNRIPYLEGISALSEAERINDDLRDKASEIGQMIYARKGGKLRSRRVIKAQPGLDMDNILNNYGNYGGVGVGGYGTPATAGLFGQDPISGQGVGLDLSSPQVSGIAPVDQSNWLTDALSQITSSGLLNSQGGAGAGGAGGAGGGQGQVLTNFRDEGSSFLRGLGQAAIPLGGAINLGANVAGAIGSHKLYSDLIDENVNFFGEQKGLANRSRDIASSGNAFDIFSGLLRQGPVDLPEEKASRLKQFDPFRGVRMRRQLAGQGIGQINSLLRGNPNTRGVNIGNAIASRNESLANAYDNAYGQEFNIDQQLDALGNRNALRDVENQQRRRDFGNTLIDDARGGFRNLFTNEASRHLDKIGLNRAEREQDILFRQNRLEQPLQYASTAGQGLIDLGAGAIAAGTNYVPYQELVGGGGGTGGGSGGGSGLGNILLNVAGSIFSGSGSGGGGTGGGVDDLFGGLGDFQGGQKGGWIF